MAWYSVQRIEENPSERFEYAIHSLMHHVLIRNTGKKFWDTLKCIFLSWGSFGNNCGIIQKNSPLMNYRKAVILLSLQFTNRFIIVWMCTTRHRPNQSFVIMKSKSDSDKLLVFYVQMQYPTETKFYNWLHVMIHNGYTGNGSLRKICNEFRENSGWKVKMSSTTYLSSAPPKRPTASRNFRAEYGPVYN